MSGTYTGEGIKAEVINVTALGEGLKHVATRKVNFTIAAADALLSMKEFVGDRFLKNSHVDYLLSAMKRGTFHPEWVNIVVCKYHGESYRMNGQHTAWARTQMDEGYPCEVTYLEYTAKDLEDMRTLYASIDRSSPRTRSNVITSYLAGTEEFADTKSNTLRMMPMGFAMWMWKSAHERGSHDGDDVAYLVKTEYYDLALKVATFLDKFSSRDYRHLMRSSVIGAIFATFNRAPQIAVEFWTPVANGTGIDRVGDPRLKLRNELMRASVDTGAGSRTDKKSVSQEFMYRQCIVAWNAYRDGRSLQLLKVAATGNRPGVK